MVHIDSCYFGSIIIDGKKYDHDIIVSWKGNIEERVKSHKFSKEEFLDLLFENPEVIIIGTGMSGLVKIDPDIEIEAKLKGIEIIHAKTPKAIEEFNKISNKKKVIGVFHTTC